MRTSSQQVLFNKHAIKKKGSYSLKYVQGHIAHEINRVKILKNPEPIISEELKKLKMEEDRAKEIILYKAAVEIQNKFKKPVKK